MSNLYGYNNYMPYPYGYQQQMQRQGQAYNMQPQMPQQPYEIPIEVKFITSEEAKAYIVMPNRASILIDKTNGLAYFKSADNMGQSTTKTYKLVELDEQGRETPLKDTKEEKTIDLSSYVKKDEISAFGFATKEEFEKFTTKMESIVKSIVDKMPNGSKD